MTPPRTQTRSAQPSATQTITDASPSTPTATLRLRAPAAEQRRGISWAEDVVDNEGMGKKSSKVCCIYHGPHEPGDESSGSDSSSSDGEEDDEPDLSRAQKAGGKGKGKGRAKRDECGDEKGVERKPSPNAYERQPKAKAKKEG